MMSIKKIGLSNQKTAPYLFILPFLISYIIFFVYPALYSFVLSFFSYKGFGKASFIGLANYKNLLLYKTMWKALGNTLFYFIFSFIPIMIFSFLLAVATRSRFVRKLQSFYKPILFLPQVCAVVASALCFKIIFGERVGVFSQMLGREIPFLSDFSLTKWSVVALISWRGIGWYYIIFLSGLTAIDNEIFEAARIDGASSFKTLVNITLPMMRPTFMMAFITNAIGTLKIYTEPNLLLAQSFDPPMQVAPYINIIVNSMNGGRFGMASAAGWILVLIILLLTFFQFRLFKEKEE